MGRVLARRQAFGWIGDEQPGHKHEARDREEPNGAAEERLAKEAYCAAGNDAHEQKQDAK